MQNLKIIFMGTPDIGALILSALLKAGFIIDSVVTRTDKPKGRSGKPQESPVKTLARENNLKIFQPKTKIELESFVKSEKPDLLIVCAFGMIITKPTIEASKYGAINVHPSLLPKWRGPAPIVAPIFHGEKETGTTIMMMDERMDEGDILAQKKYSLSGKETAPELEKALAALSAKLLVETLPKYLGGKITRKKQDHSQATYTPLLKKEDGHIFFKKYEAIGIERVARAFTPWPGVFTQWKGKRLSLFDISLSSQELAPGELNFANDKLHIGTKKGTVCVKELKLEGRNSTLPADFLRGYPDFLNVVLD